MKTDILSDLFEWSEIDWFTVNKSVRNLRSRIFQAKSSGNIRKLKNLQKLMLSSSSNIFFRIIKITYNKNLSC